MSFSAFAVRVKNEPILANLFEKHNPCRGPALRGCGREGHRIRLLESGPTSLLKPRFELCNGVRIDRRFVEPAAPVTLSKIREGEFERRFVSFRHIGGFYAGVERECAAGD